MTTMAAHANLSEQAVTLQPVAHALGTQGLWQIAALDEPPRSSRWIPILSNDPRYTVV
jgi:hypothetical protein